MIRETFYEPTDADLNAYSKHCQEEKTMSISTYDLLKLESQPAHISVVVPRTVRADDNTCNYTYFQLVCSCGYRGEWRASKVTAQMDQCENKHFNR